MQPEAKTNKSMTEENPLQTIKLDCIQEHDHEQDN